MVGQLGSCHALKEIVQIIENHLLRYNRVEHSQSCLCVSYTEEPVARVGLGVRSQ